MLKPVLTASVLALALVVVASAVVAADTTPDLNGPCDEGEVIRMLPGRSIADHTPENPSYVCYPPLGTLSDQSGSQPPAGTPDTAPGPQPPAGTPDTAPGPQPPAGTPDQSPGVEPASDQGTPENEDPDQSPGVESSSDRGTPENEDGVPQSVSQAPRYPQVEPDSDRDPPGEPHHSSIHGLRPDQACQEQCERYVIHQPGATVKTPCMGEAHRAAWYFAMLGWINQNGFSLSADPDGC